MNKVKAFPLHKKGKKWIQNVLKSKHNKINQQKKKNWGRGESKKGLLDIGPFLDYRRDSGGICLSNS